MKTQIPSVFRLLARILSVNLFVHARAVAADKSPTIYRALRVIYWNAQVEACRPKSSSMRHWRAWLNLAATRKQMRMKTIPLRQRTNGRCGKIEVS